MVKNHRHGTIGHDKHGNSPVEAVPQPHPDTKRPRSEESGGGSLDAEALERLLRSDAVTCSATAPEILGGAGYSVAIQPMARGVHQAIALLLGQSNLTSLNRALPPPLPLPRSLCSGQSIHLTSQ